MESKLLGGTTLIVDRYSYSGVAFSAAKGLDIEWCKVSLVPLGCMMISYLRINTWKLSSDAYTISGSRCWTYSSRSCNLSGCTTRGILFIFSYFYSVYTRYSVFILSIFCLYSEAMVFHNEGARFFFQFYYTITHCSDDGHCSALTKSK
jgi:hypothetical protein